MDSGEKNSDFISTSSYDNFTYCQANWIKTFYLVNDSNYFKLTGNLALSRALGDFVFKKNDKKDPREQIVTGKKFLENLTEFRHYTSSSIRSHSEAITYWITIQGAV